MSDPATIAVVRRFHDSEGDPAVTHEPMAVDITPGFPVADRPLHS